MSDFKGRHFEGEVVLWAVRWYCRYGVSYRDLEQMMGERGVSVDHSTIYRWVQKYAPEIEKRLRWRWRGPRSTSWRIDETYVRVRGQWAYLYRAVDKHGNNIDWLDLVDAIDAIILAPTVGGAVRAAADEAVQHRQERRALQRELMVARLRQAFDHGPAAGLLPHPLEGERRTDAPDRCAGSKRPSPRRARAHRA